MNELLNANEFWARLKELSHERKVMQKTFCEELGFDLQQFRNKKFLGTFPTLEQLVKLSMYFNVPLEYLLLGRTDNPYQKRIDELEDKLRQITNITSTQ